MLYLHSYSLLALKRITFATFTLDVRSNKMDLMPALFQFENVLVWTSRNVKF